MPISLPVIKKITSKEELDAVIEAAKSDDHDMRFATHVAMMDGEIVGAICLAPMPFVWGWSKKGVVKMKDSLVIRNTIATMMNERCVPMYLVACDDDSPYLPYMEGFGYESLNWKTNLFIDKP